MARAPGWLAEARLAYRLRLKRKRILFVNYLKSKELTAACDRTAQIKPGDILGFATLRNEMQRLPFYLAHHRALGVDHFLVVDNGSDDGTSAFLAEQPDVSVWHTQASYKASRFGVDWLGHLQTRYAPGHWALTLDADEILIYPEWKHQGLRALTAWLDQRGAPSMAALMLDMYPKGPLSEATYLPGTNPAEALPYFDADNYTWEKINKRKIISIRGGVRKRVFFADQPDHAPHLHKIPLIKWDPSYAYLSSAHDALPPRLNTAFDLREGLPTGVLLHSKFLNTVVDKSTEEKHRAEHFTHPERYGDYYDEIARDPDLWCPASVRYEGAAQLEALGLMTRGNWQP